MKKRLLVVASYITSTCERHGTLVCFATLTLLMSLLAGRYAITSTTGTHASSIPSLATIHVKNDRRTTHPSQAKTPRTQEEAQEIQKLDTNHPSEIAKDDTPTQPSKNTSTPSPNTQVAPPTTSQYEDTHPSTPEEEKQQLTVANCPDGLRRGYAKLFSTYEEAYAWWNTQVTTQGSPHYNETGSIGVLTHPEFVGEIYAVAFS